MSDMVECCEHGTVRPAFVCNHVFKGMNSGKKTGFIWSRDDEGQINAYCTECDMMLEAEFNGDWANVPRSRLDVSLYCENCAIRAASFNDVEIDR